MDTDMTQVKLHEKWKLDPSTYNKPPSPGPMTTHTANLVGSKSIREDLSYLLFVDGKLERQVGAACNEFLTMDPEALRRNTLHMKSRPGFHVYYKQGAYWYGVTEHFPSLADAIPYVHSGLRVLIEYRFSVLSVKYIVYPGFETGSNGEQGAFMSAQGLAEAYGVSLEECLIAEYAGYLPPNGPLIALLPIWKGDYNMHRLSIKHFGKLAATKS